MKAIITSVVIAFCFSIVCVMEIIGCSCTKLFNTKTQ